MIGMTEICLFWKNKRNKPFYSQKQIHETILVENKQSIFPDKNGVAGTKIPLKIAQIEGILPIQQKWCIKLHTFEFNKSLMVSKNRIQFFF